MRMTSRVAVTCALSAAGLVVLWISSIAIIRSMQPVQQKMATAFRDHRDEFETLRHDITANIQVGYIGTDRIGNFWKYGGAWDSAETKGRSTSEVLLRYGLTQDRYRKYLSLLANIGAYGVSGDAYDGTVQIYFASEGTLVNGKLWLLEWRRNADPPQIERTERVDRTRLPADWWLVCEHQ